MSFAAPEGLGLGLTEVGTYRFRLADECGCSEQFSIAVHPAGQGG